MHMTVEEIDRALLTATSRAPARAAAGRSQTAKDFEAVFLRQAIEEMLPKDAAGIFGGGTGGDIWRSMMADEISKVLAERGILDLSRQLDGRLADAGEDKKT